MDAILVYNDASKPEVKYTAEQFERVLKNRPGILSKAHLVSAVERKDVDFHPRSRREGFMKEVSPYFARVAGTVNAPHVITRKKKTLQQEIDEGEKAIVFNLNLNLSHRLPIMAQENPKLGFNYDEWKHENSHVAVSIKESAKKIRTVLLQVFNSAVSKTVAPEGRIFASYRGAVMPFNEFALNNDPQKFQDLFYNMYHRHGGVLLKQNASGDSPTPVNRIAGFPRLILWDAHEKFRQKAGQYAFDGNSHFCAERNAIIRSKLVFPRNHDERKTEDFQEMVAGALDISQRLYILAAPWITWDREADIMTAHLGKEQRGWEYIRWTINNPAKQTYTRPVFSPREPG